MLKVYHSIYYLTREHLEMTIFSQSPRDRVLWELVSHNGRMRMRSLHRAVDIELADLNIVLADLEKEGWIRRTVRKNVELISLLDW